MPRVKRLIMSDAVPMPSGYHRITPCLMVKPAAEAIEFYKALFSATEIMRFNRSDERIVYAELQIGDSKIMLGEGSDPETIDERSTPISSLYLYVADVDRIVEKGVEMGAVIVQSAENKFYGDRCATLRDPFGHQWTVAAQVEEVPVDELIKRASVAGMYFKHAN